MIIFNEGEVVIVSATNQSGCLIKVENKEIWVLLANNDIFVGQDYQVRHPQSQEDLDSCVRDVEKVPPKLIKNRLK